MSVLVENRFGNLGVVSRISHILLAKVITIVTAYGGLTFGAFVSSGWLVFPILLAAYLLFTGLIGWTPLIALDNYIKGINTKRFSETGFTATTAH
jgi:hypothetical protein